MSSPLRDDLLSSPMALHDSALSPLRSSNTVQGTRSTMSQSTPGRTPNTPSTRRGDLAGAVSLRSGGLTSEADETTVIWGTTVNIRKTMDEFRRFLNRFPQERDAIDVGDGPEPFYPRLLEQLRVHDEYNINLDCSNILKWSETLYLQLVRYPQEVISIFDLVLNEEFTNRFPDLDEARLNRLQVRTFNLRTARPMRDLDPVDIDQLVAVRGMIIRASSVIPDLKEGFFQCQICQWTTAVPVERGRVAEPDRCGNCSARKSTFLIHNRCAFANKQMIKLQETPESIPEGETPHTVSMIAYDDLVDVCKPGDRVEITGIYRAMPIRVSGGKRTIKSVYRTYIDVLHVRKLDARRIAAEDPSSMRSNAPPAMDDPRAEWYTSFDETDRLEEREMLKVRRLRRLAERADIYDVLTRSVAPSIWELDDVKRGLLCMLFGGVNKKLETGKIRGELNVLLCGDPGTSKSQLLQYVHKLAPRGIYTSGKGSSAVGLTAYVTKDPDSKELVLESGALVLSDRGICCIDEFDKMTDHTRSVLHEVMEQQTVSIAKAGIIATLNARASILASANPIESRYNPRRSVVDNLDLPPTIVSRFDLIYLILDKVDEATDRHLAKHLISLYYAEPEVQPHELPVEDLAAYISYAKEHVHPVLTDEAKQMLVDGYWDLRRAGAEQHGGRKTISATTRQLESLVRLAEAQARMRWQSEVTAEHVSEAIRLMKAALKATATDPTTGRIDMTLINTGMSDSARARLDTLAQHITAILGARSQPAIKLDELADQLRHRRDAPAFSEQDLHDAVTRMVDQDGGTRYVFDRDTIRRT